MKNTMMDLNNHLFEQLERLNDEELSNEDLQKEISRGKAMSDVASKIIANAQLGLEASKYQNEFSRKNVKLPAMLEVKEDK